MYPPPGCTKPVPPLGCPRSCSSFPAPIRHGPTTAKRLWYALGSVKRGARPAGHLCWKSYACETQPEHSAGWHRHKSGAHSHALAHGGRPGGVGDSDLEVVWRFAGRVGGSTAAAPRHIRPQISIARSIRNSRDIGICERLRRGQHRSVAGGRNPELRSRWGATCASEFAVHSMFTEGRMGHHVREGHVWARRRERARVALVYPPPPSCGGTTSRGNGRGE